MKASKKKSAREIGVLGFSAATSGLSLSTTGMDDARLGVATSNARAVVNAKRPALASMFILLLLKGTDGWRSGRRRRGKEVLLGVELGDVVEKTESKDAACTQQWARANEKQAGSAAAREAMLLC